ncbi:MAG: hypothetical protein H6895_00155 [Defluviimonas sp.]|uniref:hypothetical protein n=1 Tax=Albidovulum sp. TaxID=1872424 RepID=UPI002A2FBEA5|nr:hypothetical protein [Defluviimonas sp.]
MIEFATLIFESVSQFVSKNQALVTLVVVPIVSLALTHWIANRTDKRATIDRAAQRKLSKQIKLSEFEIDRLKDLRRDLADYLDALRSWRMTNEPSHAVVTGLYHRALLQLDRHDNSYDRFVRVSGFLLKAPSFPEFASEYENLKALAVDILSEGKASTYSSLIKVDEPQ